MKGVEVALTMALGIIEAGHIPAIAAADAALKAADVHIIAFENSYFDGFFTLKLGGKVDAVTAAVEAGESAAKRIGEVRWRSVIPRLAPGIDMVIYEDRNPKPVPPAEEAAESADQCPTEAEDPGTGMEDKEQIDGPEAEEQMDETAVPGEQAEPEEAEPRAATCNLCNDPLCPRLKGEKHILCIHYRIKEEVV